MPKKRLNLEEEGGVTAISLRNAQKLLEAYGKPSRVDLYHGADPEYFGHLVDAWWPSGERFTFSGFSWGYGGEGPHGLAKFAEMIGLEHLLPIQVIARLPDGQPHETVKAYTYQARTFGVEPEWTNG